MKKTIIKTLAAFSLFTLIISGLSFAADTPPQKNELSTSNYSSTVAAILKNYNPATLTAADAKAINNAFRSAGIKAGEEQKKAIQAAGFDPHSISSLDPPPERKSQNREMK